MKMQSKIRSLMFAGALLTSGCQGVSVFKNQNSGPITTIDADKTTPTPASDDFELPTVEVAGVNLVGQLVHPDGSPASDVQFDIMDFEQARIVYSTKTNQQGEYSLPVSKIKENTLGLHLKMGAKSIFSEILLPEGLKSSSEHMLALQLPENITSTATTNSLMNPEKQRLNFASMLRSTSSNAKPVKFWTKVFNQTSHSSVRFAWEKESNINTSVRIVFATSESALSSWNGQLASAPLWPEKLQGENVVSHFSGCHDPNDGSPKSEAMNTLSGQVCGFLRSHFPFNLGQDVFARLAAESADQIRLSPIFRIQPSAHSLVLAQIPDATLAVSATQTHPLSITYAGGSQTMSCTMAVSAKSSNPDLLPDDSIVIGGTFPNCSLGLNPSNQKSGVSTVHVRVTDGYSFTEQKFRTFVNSNQIAAPNISTTSVTGLRASLMGTCDPNANEHTAQTSLGRIYNLQCSGAGVLSAELHLPQGLAQNFEVVVTSKTSSGSFVSSPVIPLSRTSFRCPPGHVGVPRSNVGGLGHPSASIGNANAWLDVGRDFCVMKYPAKAPVANVAESIQSLTPWVNIPRGTEGTTDPSAFRACSDRNLYADLIYRNNGTYRLISNMQWQTVARNAADIGKNWTLGSVGQGMLPRGHSDDNPSTLLEHSLDSDPFFGTGNSVINGPEQRRTNWLSNDEVVWDFGGNLGQWVSDDVSELSLPSIGSGEHQFSTLAALFSKLIFMPDNVSIGSSQGVGRLYFSGTTGIRRGGRYNGNAEDSGLFGVTLSADLDANALRGFRCVYVPNP